MEKLWKNTISTMEKGGKTVENTVSTMEKSGKKGISVGQRISEKVDYHWKSSRKSFSNRLNNDIPNLMIGGVGFFVSLSTTYMGFDIVSQLVSYICTLSFVVLTDPLHLFRRILSLASRRLTFILSILFIASMLMNNRNLWKVFVITSIVFFALMFCLNDFWLRSESWNLSREVEHSIHGDPDNKAGSSWQACGKDNTRTVLYSLGYTPTEAEIDTMFKAVYSVGYWNSMKKHKDQSEELYQMQFKVAMSKQNFRDELDEYKAEHNNQLEELQRQYDELVILYDRASKKISEYENRVLAENYEIENNIVIPEGVTVQQCENIIDLLKKDEPVRSIERITGVSRYKVDKIKIQIEGKKV